MNPNRSKPSDAQDTAVLETEALVQAGLAASQEGEPLKALHLFARACDANPASAMPHFLMGSEYAALGDVERAETALANAVVLAPALHIARYQLGLLQFSSGRPSLAFVSWGPLLELDDAQPLPYFVRGFAALAQDDFTAAQAHFEAGLLRNPDNPPLSADIQKVMASLAQAKAGSEPAAKSQGDPVAEHVLVSNYGKFGTLH
ncbi:MAG: Tetratricopeptide domain protein [Ramlibacter sp.]|jgi:tetratricopeptide (TPR) repeat protein|nr:Tetratricopeptide domain protein [Ramlibacter sp.]